MGKGRRGLLLVAGLALTTPASGETRSPREVILAVARHQLRPLSDGEYLRGDWPQVLVSRDPKGVNWVYPWGVTLLGMLRTGQVTGDQELERFVVTHNQIVARYYQYLRWVQTSFAAEHPEEVRAKIQVSPIRRVMNVSSLDIAGAMSAQMFEAFLRHGAKPTTEQEGLLQLTTDWVANRQARLPDGTFWRPDTNQTLWSDDLFMSCSLLTRWYERTGERRLIDDAARQVLGMASRQQDADGLWFHANFVAEGKPSPFKWGRANGWAMVATAEVLSVLPPDHRDRTKVLEVFRKHVAGVERLQAPSGLWRQVLDHPELWEEMSATGMFAFSIARAVERGWLPPEKLAVAERAFAGMTRNISEQGQVAGTCEGTLIGRDLAYYVSRRRPLDDQHAPGPVLLAGAELLSARAALARSPGGAGASR
jgi:unsaturated rhamnogalacturonyl hydrolase